MNDTENCSLSEFQASSNNATWMTFIAYNYAYLLSSVEIRILTAARLSIVGMGLFGNITLLVSIFRQDSSKKRPFDIYLANLAALQLIMLAIPDLWITVLYHTGGQWRWGHPFCMTFLFILGSPLIFVNVIHMLLAIDRLMKIGFSKHAKFQSMSLNNAKLASGVAWILGFGISCRLIHLMKLTTFNFAKNCSFDICQYTAYKFENRYSAYIIFEVILLLLPLILVIVMNVLLIILLFSLKKRIGSENSQTRTFNLGKERRAIISIVVSGTIILLSWGGYYMILFAGFYFEPQPWFIQIGPIVRVINGAVTPFVYETSYADCLQRRRRPNNDRQHAPTTLSAF